MGTTKTILDGWVETNNADERGERDLHCSAFVFAASEPIQAQVP
jgi:hypothetical protein